MEVEHIDETTSICGFLVRALKHLMNFNENKSRKFEKIICRTRGLIFMSSVQ